MTMKFLFSAIAATMLTLPAFAQEAGTSAGSEATSAPHSMKGMMDQCRTHCRDTQQQITAATEAIKNAKASGDAGATRQALDKAEASLSKISDNMTKCLSMMDMMSNMHGNGMMGGQGMMGAGMMQGQETQAEPQQ